MQKEKFSLKDHLFNETKVTYLANLLEKNIKDFNKEKFIKEICEKFSELELKQRINHIAFILAKYLPKDFEEASKIIIKSLPKELDPNNTDNDFWDFIFAPLWVFVEKNWISEKYLDISLNTLEELTKRFSMESSIRVFINKHEEKTLEKVILWSKSDNYHVRRLASEWTRPKLPWAEKINLDYKKTIEILDNLYHDKTRYVTRSLANHLNDISKIDFELVLTTLQKWEKDWKQVKEEFEFIKKHSLRTLVKDWNKETLAYMWLQKAQVNIFKFKNEKKEINIWEKLSFEIDLLSNENQEVIIDYIVHFLNSKNKYWKKVYKIWKYKLEKEQTLNIIKSHLFDNFSTRTLYKWIHKIELQINWDIFGIIEFEIK